MAKLKSAWAALPVPSQPWLHSKTQKLLSELEPTVLYNSASLLFAQLSPRSVFLVGRALPMERPHGWISLGFCYLGGIHRLCTASPLSSLICTIKHHLAQWAEVFLQSRDYLPSAVFCVPETQITPTTHTPPQRPHILGHFNEMYPINPTGDAMGITSIFINSQ